MINFIVLPIAKLLDNNVKKDDKNNIIFDEKPNKTEEDSEGCLSVEGYSGKVVRPKNIVVKAKDENMNEMEFDAEGFFARIICHEVDHLNGILYTDKVVPGTLEDINEENENAEGES